MCNTILNELRWVSFIKQLRPMNYTNHQIRPGQEISPVCQPNSDSDNNRTHTHT